MAVERRTLSPPLVLGLFAMLLYLPGFWWGVPQATAPDRTSSWGVDDEAPLGPLAELHNIVDPKPDRDLGYPLLHSFVTAAAYAPYLVYLRVTGQLGQVSPVYPFNLADPVHTLYVLGLLAHFLTVLMAAGVVVAVYHAARTLWDSRAGIVAGVLMAVSFPMFYYARTGNVDVPVLFWTALAFAAFARLLAAGVTTRRAAWLGLFIGCALATKEPSFASFVAVPFVILGLQWRAAARLGGAGATALWRPLVALLVATALAFGAGSGLVVDPDRFFAHMAFAAERAAAVASGEVAFLGRYPWTWAGHVALGSDMTRHLTSATTLPGLALAGGGLAWALLRRDTAALFALPAATYLGVLFWSAHTTQLRYLMPVVPTVACFAGGAAAYALGSRRPALVWGAGGLALAAIGLGLLRGADLTHAMIGDSRYAAGAWLDAHARPGDRVHFFGPAQKLPPLAASVQTERPVPYLGAVHPPDVSDEVVRTIRERWATERPEFVVIIPDHSSAPGAPHSASCPPEIYRALVDGSLGYRLAVTFETPSLLPWARRPALDYPAVNPPIRIFVPQGSPASS